jgi:D-alanyl-lipoteichoic acid acyltransferase DltB (MBOAT superfamily)
VRDYVFAPLGGVARRSALRTIFNTTAAMTLMGLWHGAAWRFVLWGAGNGLVLSAYYVWRLHVPVGRRTRPTVLGLAAGWAATTACEMLLGVLFFAPDLATVALCWKRLFTAPWTSWLDPATGPLAAFCLAFWAVQFAGRTLDWRGAWDRLPAPVRGLAFATLVYVVLFGSVPVVEQFIYFQF